MSKHIIPVLCIILVAAAEDVYTGSKGKNESSLQTNNGEQEHPISIVEVMATLKSVQKEMTAKLDMLQKNMASQMQTLEKIQNDIAEQKVDVTAKLDMLQKNTASQMQTLEKIQNDIAKQKKVDVTAKLDMLQKNMASQMQTLENNVIQYSNLVYYNSTHMAKKYYSEYEITFVGSGYREDHDDYTYKRDISFEYCLQYCKQVRDDQGDEWNGLFYLWTDRLCYCEKNETGHIVDKSYFHYKFH